MSKLIGFLYRNILKPILFRFEPETIHNLFIYFGGVLGKYSFLRRTVAYFFYFSSPLLKQKVCGLVFENPIGLSAGFDKDAKAVSVMKEVGFGFMEVGSVTNASYEGNPKPRLKRYPKSKSILVNFGLKNEGADVVSERLKSVKKEGFVLGVSVAKTNCKLTSDSGEGVKDYVATLKTFEKKAVADFYVLNISCPNAFGGESFADETLLSQLLTEISSLNIQKPIFLKMPINLGWWKFKPLLDVAVKFAVSGVVIGNLNKVRHGELVFEEIPQNLPGALSGKPTEKLSNELISKTFINYGESLKIVGVGGVFSAQDAYEKIKRGASLVSLITGMIYEGPQLIGEINRELVKLMKKDGFSNIEEAIGSYNNGRTRN